MRFKKNVRLGLAASGVLCAFGGTAHAGAWDTLGLGSMDLLFAPEAFVVEGGATYANRNVDYKVTKATARGANQLDTPYTPASNSKKERVTPNIWNYQIGVKAELMDNLNCLGQVNNPLRITEEMDPTWAGRYAGYETHATTLGLNATCAYTFGVSNQSQMRVIAGVRAVDLTYQSDGMIWGTVLGGGLPSGVFSVDPTADYVSGAELKSDGMRWGWRAGFAYEIPAYALRASVIYDSEISMSLEGETYVNDVPLSSGGTQTVTGSAFAELTLPQAIEVNIQSGIAPKWLASFGVKWVDWSVVDRLILRDETGELKTDRILNFDDGWTVKAGIGHQYSDKLSLGSSLQWDRGVGGSYSDTYTVGLGGSYALNEHMRVILGGAAIYKTSGSGDANNLASGAFNEYDYDGSWNFAVNTKLRVAF